MAHRKYRIERNVDSLVHVRCSKKLYQQSTSIQYNTVFGEIELVFSKCPLVNHLDINIRNKDNFTNEQIDTIMSQVKNDFQLKINSFLSLMNRNKKGNQYHIDNDYNNAILFYEKSLKNNEDDKYITLRCISKTYFNMNKFDLALQNIKKVYKLIEIAFTVGSYYLKFY